jgi:hypothetical protein
VRILVRLIFWSWFLAALVAGRLQWLVRLPAWGLFGAGLGLAAAALAAIFGFRAGRAWLAALDLRWLVLAHTVRFYGFFILVLYGRGEVPYALVPGAWSDILVALLAVGAALLPLSDEVRRHLFVIWNTVGLMGLLLVAFAVGRIGFGQPWQLGAFQRLPLSLLPTFLGPLLLVTHVIIYARLLPAAPETARPA